MIYFRRLLPLLGCIPLVVGCSDDGPVETTDPGDPVVMVSDDFSPEEELGEPWRFWDPVGDVTLTATGSNIELALPAGSTHDLWMGTNQAPRVLQPAPDTDFGVEIKIESELMDGISMNGIIVHEIDQQFLRFGTYSDGGIFHVFVAFIAIDGATILLDEIVPSNRELLRVEREGDVWIYSTAGADEDLEVIGQVEQVMAVSELGFYVGNAGESPAYTGSIDYFNNLADPIEDTDDQIIEIPDPPPPLDIWHGAVLNAGPGLGQTWVNVLGKVYDEDGVRTVSYVLNNDAPLTVPVGADGFRLFNDGDFNIELDPADLIVGSNTVTVTMEDELGDTVTDTITLDYDDSAGPTLPLLADWGGANRIDDVGQIIDGHWQLEGAGVRTVEPGYDRLIAIGDHTWGPHMEVTTSFTLHSHLETGGVSGIGVAFGWQGHQGGENPKLEWPLEALCWVRGFPWDSQFQIITYPETVRAGEPRPEIEVEVEYVLKARSEPAGVGTSRISTKLWPATAAEPGGWDLTFDVPERGGAVLLVSHLVDVTWGRVDIQPVP